MTDALETATTNAVRPCGETRLSKGLYDMNDGVFSPSIHTGSPWSMTTQHGGPINALLMYGVESAALGTPKRVARLSVDILRPVPREPLRLTTRILREGRRLAVVDAALERESGDQTLHGSMHRCDTACSHRLFTPRRLARPAAPLRPDFVPRAPAGHLT